MNREELLQELKAQRKTIDEAIMYIEERSISKMDLLLHLNELNKDPRNVAAVKSFYYKFFKEDEKEEEQERWLMPKSF